MKAEIHWNISKRPVPGGPVGFDTVHGAGLEFLGVVRELEQGRSLSGIHYSVYPAMAEAEMRRLCGLHEREFPLTDASAAVTVWIHHRLGFVPVGVASLAIRVHTGHSGEAFDRCRWWLDQIKRRLPVWKRPVYRDDGVGSDAGAGDA